ncbi:DUF4136 domain-containing protein [Shewanella sp. Choline-02u-19]|uniref:DUF4136 domain-containing protein n=1 Tax=unclassified Shewanella TaxID=196818 RepID=UPI000C337A7D|nr:MULTISPECIES: DUF4136 domain-containing protein [unclassified Shewanella]PKH56217.1 DUF4136 domain-containing protein [Shewanella sp. Bg11-22]PKI28713.1 DUF4136 domain-containing protein [Shewanella sp. Choline-02u-19]
MNTLKRTLLICLLSLPLLSLLGCSSPPKNDYDLDYNFSPLKTFSQVEPAQTTDPLSAARIQQSIAAALIAQGFIQQDEAADFLVTYGFRVDDKPKDSGFSIGLGAGSWGSSSGASIGTSVDVPVGSDTAKIQTIQIDVLDPQTQKLIWRGSDKFTFDDGGEEKAQETNATVSKILALFPPQKKP